MKIKESFLSETQRFSLWAPVLFGLGIGIYFLLPFEPSIWITLAIIETLIVTAIIWRFHMQKLIVLGIIALVVLGFTNIQLKSLYLSKIKPIDEEKTIYIRGQIESKDYNSRGKPRFILTDIKDFEQNKTLDKIKISMLSDYPDFKVGQCLEVVAKIMPPMPTPFEGAFQFDRKAFFEQIQGNGFALSGGYETQCKTPKNPIMANIRDSIIAKINKLLPKDQAGIVAAIVAGEQGKIPKKIINQYRDSGLAHFLSISGLHMSMVAGFMFLLIRYILVCIPQISLRFDIKKIAAIMAILIAAFYLAISGAKVPTQRAFIMTLIVLMGVLCERKAISIKTISIAAMLILIISPEALISASFQMSFAAVCALIAFYEKFATQIHKFTTKFGFIISYILGLLIADFIASTATLPFAIYHFNRIAIYTTLGNLMAGPIIGIIIMPFVLISLISMPFGLELIPLKIIGFGVQLVNNITAWVANLDYAGLSVPQLPLWGLILIVLGGLWLCLWQQKWRKWGWIAIITGSLSLFSVQKPQNIIGYDGTILATTNSKQELVIVKSKGRSFEKRMVKEKFNIKKSEKIDTTKLSPKILKKNKRFWSK